LQTRAALPNLKKQILHIPCIPHMEIGNKEITSHTGNSGPQCRNSIASCADEQPHIRNYRLFENDQQEEFCKSEIGMTHPHRQRVAIKIIDKTQFNSTMEVKYLTIWLHMEE
uniref:Uncharacterized protein n=1 Tax=Urocitellus parryii TaxID=9999 RepID=A0A8D2HWP8_UROPR